jgi:hypothetical protein
MEPSPVLARLIDGVVNDRAVDRFRYAPLGGR